MICPTQVLSWKAIIFAERSDASQDTIHFFPQVSNRKKRDKTYYKQNEGCQCENVTELCQALDSKGKGHTLNPRSKHTRVFDGCGTKSVKDVQGSGGEGATSTRAPLCICEPCQPSRAPNIKSCLVSLPRVHASNTGTGGQCEIDKDVCSSRIVASTSPTLLPTPSSSKAKHLVFNMTTQSRAISPSQHRSKHQQKSSCATVRKSTASKASPGQRRKAKCTAVKLKGKRKNNLNYNHSASSLSATNSTSSRVVYTKRYPSLRSPYNKKVAPINKTDMFANLLHSRASSHWLRPGGTEFLCTEIVLILEIFQLWHAFSRVDVMISVLLLLVQWHKL